MTFGGTVGVSVAQTPPGKLEPDKAQISIADTAIFEKALITKPNGVYAFADQLYVVQEVAASPKGQTRTSQKLLLATTILVLDWVRRQRNFASSSPIETGQLGELMVKKYNKNISNLNAEFMGRGRTIYRRISSKIGKQILAFPKSQIETHVKKQNALPNWTQIRRSVWATLIRQKSYNLLKLISLELGNWDDFIVYSYRAEPAYHGSRTYPFIGPDPIVSSQLAVRNSKNNGIINGLETGSKNIKTSKRLQDIPRYLARFRYSTGKQILRYLRSISNKTDAGHEREFLSSMKSIFDLSQREDAYFSLRKSNLVGLYYVHKSGGFVQYSDQYSDIAPLEFEKALADFNSDDARRHATLEKRLLQALSRAPRFQPSWSHLAAVYLAESKNFEAMAALRMALSLSPEDLGVRRNLALVYQNVGLGSLAKRIWHSILDRSKLDDAKSKLIFRSAIVEAKSATLRPQPTHREAKELQNAQ